ncbi:MAG: heparinase II/III-family protein [Bacteroidota bacterium]
MSASLRLFHTLRHLRPRQLAYQIFYRLSGRLAATGAQPRVLGKDPKAEFLPPAPPGRRVQLPIRLTAPITFTFLNESVAYPSPETINWNEPRHGKLWTYNLNYFEYLRQPDCPDANALIASWVAGEATHRDGWEPYPISLRLVNWLQYYRERGEAVPPEVHASIQRQYAALSRKIEYHLDGNHLLENLLALRITARYLRQDRYGKALDQVRQDQYLADGAHYERSIMYHAVLLWRWLDYFSWFPEETGTKMQLEQQLGWLRSVVTNAGGYPHFNDSTNGIAPDLAELFRYATALGLQPTAPSVNASGYHRFDTEHFTCWLDAAPIGPDHIPGHAHADNLTFVLRHADGRPLIVDVGISTYEKNERRAYERSTAAHNTVEIGGQNSSDVWGGFRVGKRARTQVLSKDEATLVAAHDGYGTPHQRTWRVSDDELVITDDIGSRKGIARFHFHEAVAPVLTDAGLSGNGVRLNWSGSTQADLTDYERAAGFNSLVFAKVLQLTFVGRLETRVSVNP